MPILPAARALLLAVTLAAATAPSEAAAAGARQASAPEVAAPADPDSSVRPSAGAARLLNDVSAAYRGLASYHFEGTMRVEVGIQGQTQNVDMPFTLAMARPGKKRTEIVNPMLRMLQVSDGETTWMYVPQLQQYTKKVASPLAGDSTFDSATIATGTPVARYLAMTDGMRASRLVREEAVEIGGEPRACYVIEAEYQHPVSTESEALPTTFWIEKTRHIVVRESTLVKLSNSPAGGPMTMNQVTRFEVALVNQPIADSLFTFRPPEGATEVGEIAMPGMQEPESELVGRSATPFTLENLAGKPTALAAWKGKVVLLDFWASWCGPCRMELPTIAKLHRELGPKGLVVVGVNVGESRVVASRFLKKNGYAFAVLLDADSEVSQQYGANGLPTVVVIDREGTISSHFIGVRSEDVLREAIRKAGID